VGNGHSLDPKGQRTSSIGDGMVSRKHLCCGVRQWLCGASMNRKKHFIEPAITRLVGTPWVCWACKLCILRCPNRRCHSTRPH
jgi:hypothetical protein